MFGAKPWRKLRFCLFRNVVNIFSIFVKKTKKNKTKPKKTPKNQTNQKQKNPTKPPQTPPPQKKTHAEFQNQIFKSVEHLWLNVYREIHVHMPVVIYVLSRLGWK